MQRLAALLAFCLAFVPLRAASSLLTLENALLPSPAGVGACAPQFVSTGNGFISLFWTEPGADNLAALRIARFDPQTLTWGQPVFVGPASTGPSVEPSRTHSVTTSSGGRMATVWFVDEGNDSRVLLSLSPDAGAHFLMPLRIQDTRPLGSPDLVLLADGTVFVSWLEQYGKDEAAIWLRRISPGGELSVPVLLATVPDGHLHPRLALLSEGASPRLLLAYTLGGEGVSQIVTRLLTIAPAPTRTPAKDCNCPTGDEAARGYPLRAHIVTLQRADNTLTVQHTGIAGVLPPGSTTFKVEPELFNLVAGGADIFARTERRGPDWWLFDVRLIVRPETTRTSPP